ncbi:hypothetical protein EON64_08075 [archaeon]|nr:MAG: hypothetical protein EON64_08075 [archaeon]
MSAKVLAERALSIDRAYEIVNAGGHSSQIVHSTDNEDLASLSTLLINMFKEADDDGSGELIHAYYFSRQVYIDSSPIWSHLRLPDL